MGIWVSGENIFDDGSNCLIRCMDRIYGTGLAFMDNVHEVSFIGNLNEGIIIGKSLSFFFHIFTCGIRDQIGRLVIGTEENGLIKRTLIFPIWILCFKKYEIVMIQVSGPGPFSQTVGGMYGRR